MAEAFSKLFDLIANYPFVRYAILVAVLIALCAALLGVCLVLKRFSMIGDGLSHVAFGAMAVAMVLGLSDNMILTLPVTIVTAVILFFAQRSKRVNGDALIAMISVGAMAVGYLLLHLFGGTSNIAGDVCSTLFGSTAILTLSTSDVILCVVLSVGVIVYYVLCYNRIYAVTFDENFARASGSKVNLRQLILAIVIATTTVVAMKLVGSLLASALIVFPALSAMRVCRSYKGVSILAAVLSVTCALFGLLGSILWETPVGPTIIVFDIVCFAACFVIGLILRKRA